MSYWKVYTPVAQGDHRGTFSGVNRCVEEVIHRVDGRGYPLVIITGYRDIIHTGIFKKRPESFRGAVADFLLSKEP